LSSGANFRKKYGKNVSLILWRVELYQSESCTCIVCDTSLQEYRVIMSSGTNSRKKRYWINVSFFILWKVEIYRPKSYTEVVYDSLYGFTITFTEACIISNLIDLYNDERLKNMWKIKCNIEKYYFQF
jgi:hypothetical protein